MKLLIVEDEAGLRTPMRKFLEKRNFSVSEAIDGTEAMELISIEEYDCILLDLNLPSVDGVEVAKKVREKGVTTPIIMVTARSQVYNKLEGFDVGADDYITKPFDLNELVARINTVIRRSSVNKEVILTFGENEIFPSKNLVLLRNRGRGIADDNGRKEVFLSNKESAILEYLLRKKGEVVSAEELLDHIWGNGVDMFSETVKTHIKTLRQKIDKDKKYIKTVRGKGYTIEL